MSFQYYMPTHIIQGEGCVEKNGPLLASLGKRALIVTGKRSARENGSLFDVLKALENNGQAHLIFDKVMSNPTVGCVYAGADIARVWGADFVIGIGGGSPMDAAKAIAVVTSQDLPKENLFTGPLEPKMLPVVCIPTTAGTGSEVTQYAILTDDDAQTKTSLASPAFFPSIAFLDSRYLNGLSRKTAIHTSIDALSHLIEGYLSVRASAVTDALALEGMRVIADLFDSIRDGTLSAEEQGRLLAASTIGGIVIANTGTTAVHAMGYSLTYFKNIDHGRANGLLMTEFLKYVERHEPRLVRTILGAMRFRTLAAFSDSVDGLLGEREYISADSAAVYAAKAVRTKNTANCILIPTQEDLEEIIRNSLRIAG